MTAARRRRRRRRRHRPGHRLAPAQAGLTVTVCDPRPRQPGHPRLGRDAGPGHRGPLRRGPAPAPQPRRGPALGRLRRRAGGRVRPARRLPHRAARWSSPSTPTTPAVLEDLAGYLDRLDLDAELLSGSGAPGASSPPSPRACAGACGSPATTRPTTGCWPPPSWPRSTGRASTVVRAGRGPHRRDRRRASPGVDAWPTARRSPTGRSCSPPGCWSGQIGGLPADAAPARPTGEGPDPAHPGPGRPTRPARQRAGPASGAGRSTSSPGPAAASWSAPPSRSRASTPR